LKEEVTKVHTKLDIYCEQVEKIMEEFGNKYNKLNDDISKNSQKLASLVTRLENHLTHHEKLFNVKLTLVSALIGGTAGSVLFVLLKLSGVI